MLIWFKITEPVFKKESIGRVLHTIYILNYKEMCKNKVYSVKRLLVI